MRRVLIPVVAIVLIAVACGGGKKESSLTGDQGASASPGATASAKPGKTTGPAKATAKPATGSSSTGTTSSGGQTKAAAPKVVSGGYAPPKDGTYVYRLDGEATSAFNPGAGPQKFSNETLTRKVSHSGNVITTEQTSSVQAGKATQKLRWESDRVLLTYVKAETPQGEYSCEFDPPLLVTRFPVRPGTIPTQQFKGKGNACNGSVSITVERRDSAKDANGKSWDAWRVHVKTDTKAGQFTQKSDDTRFVAPALSTDVRSQGNFDVTGTGGQSVSRGTQSTALKSYPK